MTRVLLCSPGVRLAYEPQRSPSYGVWIEVRLGTKGWPTYKVMRGRKGWATEAEGVTAYHAACREIAAMRAEVEADEEKYRALLAPAALPAAPRGTILFEPLARNWLQLNVRSLEAATYRGYKGLLERILLPTMRAWPVTDEAMSRKRLHDFLGKDLYVKGVSLSTRVAALRCLSALFAWALVFGDVKHLTFNPALQLGKHLRQAGERRHKKAPPNPMTRDQAAAFLTWVKDQRRAFWEWFLFLLDTGARQGEASALKWEHLDLDIAKAHLVEAFSGSQRWLERQEGDEDGAGEKDLKTHRTDQWIDLSPRLVTALRELQAEERKEAFRCGRPMPQHVFVNTTGEPQRPDGVMRDVFRDACTELKLLGQTGRAFTPHCLRDSFATGHLMAKKDVGWVAMMLGHASEGTTLRYYYKWVRQAAANPLANEAE